MSMNLIGMKLKPAGDLDYFEMMLKSTSDWSNAAKARQFVNILVSEGGFLVPKKFDRREPERFIFDTDDLTKFMEIWTPHVGGPITSRKKPYPTWMMIDMHYRESKMFNRLSSGFDERYFDEEENIDKLLSCAKHLYDWGGVTHGYLCHAKDWNSKNRYGRIVEDAKGRLSAGGGNRLDEGLPGIYWANFFGPTYIDFFGVDKFLTVPAHYKEKLADGGYLLLTSESPFDYDQTKVRKLEEKIINHLGREAFFEKKHPKKVCKVAQFTFEQASLGRPIKLIAYDPVTEAIPDAKHFIEKSAQLAEEMKEHIKVGLDFSPESLERVDDFIIRKSYRQSDPWKKERWRLLIQRLTAYYGEVLCRNLHGKWITREVAKDIFHPTVIFIVDKQEEYEYPFSRVDKLWSERERTDGLAIRYYLLASGNLKKAEQFFSPFVR